LANEGKTFMDILLVEDDASLSLLLQQMLRRYGHEVRACASAEEAWECLEQQDYPLLVLDWVLPGMSGLELCRRIRQRQGGSFVYIWVITARNTREDLLEVLAAGANDYLAKPIDIALLEVRVRIAVQQALHLRERQRAEAELAAHQAVLEQRVGERTEALSRSVQALEAENAQRRAAEDQLGQARDQLRALASRLLSIQEEQQKRISREIHDELGQAMTALKLDLGWLAAQLGEQEVLQAKIARMIPLVSGTITTIQRICAELRPGILDDLGLVAALEWLVQEFSERSGLSCRLDVEPEELDVPPELATTLFRICQEALTNVMRHAQARSVQIRLLCEDGEIRLRISDDGVGIPAGRAEHPMSLGLMGMRERVQPWNGQIQILGSPGQGTEIRVRIAVNSE
ncbi:MAG: response regulator, partial [Candidatus Sericytochromatia bacterium]